MIPVQLQNNNIYVECVPRTMIIGAWNAPYDIFLI